MLVFVRQGLVLLATPKTASTALQLALARHADIVTRGLPAVKHISYPKYLRQVAPLVDGFVRGPVEVCALVRAPLDWLGSWYRFRQRDDIPDAEKGTAGMGFDDFVRDYLADPRPPHADVGSQARFLTVPDQGLAVDRLFAYERIDRFVAFLEDRLDCEIILPKLNVSPLASMELSAGTRARHRDAATADYALWEGLAHG